MICCGGFSTDTIELLAPAGNMESLRAAVQNGADAVYLGGVQFGARGAAENFPSLEAAVAYAHLRGVRVYLTVNTLIGEDEYAQLALLMEQAAQAGVDACIMQDVGAVRWTQQHVPAMPLHASTQMGIMGEAGARWAKEMGFERAIAARECTLEDLRAMAQVLPVEAFVQGALCVCYSGQCLMSSMIGGRSGNRGHCAQPCRLPYTLGEREGFLLSPRDLCLLKELPALGEAGVTSIKIEGRLRRPEYVAIATAAYRHALDALLSGEAFDASAWEQKLFAVFNRGAYTQGYLYGCDEKTLLNAARPNHAGTQVGEIRDGTMLLKTALNEGDSIEIRPSGKGFAAPRDMAVGSHKPPIVGVQGALFRSVDVALMKWAQGSYATERRAQMVDVQVQLRPQEAARLTIGGLQIQGDVVQKAQTRPLTEQEIRKQIDKLGDAPLAIRTCEIEARDAFLPVSALNGMRRRGVAAWEAQKLAAMRRYPAPAKTLEAKETPLMFAAEGRPLLALQNGDVAQLLAAQGVADELYFAPLDWREGPLKEALQTLSGAAWLVLPFWLEGEALHRALACARGQVKGYVAGSGGQMSLLKNERVISDISAHAFSARAVRAWVAQGAQRCTLSPEMTMAQIKAAARGGPCEIIVHGQLPLMTMRACPARAALDEALGYDSAQAGLGACPARAALDEAHAKAECALCSGSTARLVDRKGNAMLLQGSRAVDGCRTTIYNAHRLCGLLEWDALMQTGLCAVRVLGDVRDAQAYRGALEGQIDAAYLQAIEHPTRGHWRRGVI